MPIISIQQNMGPTAAETYVTQAVRSGYYSDGSVAPGAALFDYYGNILDAELMNYMALAVLDDDNETDYDVTVDGNTNFGMSTGFN